MKGRSEGASQFRRVLVVEGGGGLGAGAWSLRKFGNNFNLPKMRFQVFLGQNETKKKFLVIVNITFFMAYLSL